MRYPARRSEDSYSYDEFFPGERAGPPLRRTGGNCFLGRLLVPDDHEHIAVGHFEYVMMGQLHGAGEAVIPDRLAVEGEFLDVSGRAGTVAGGWPLSS